MKANERTACSVWLFLFIAGNLSLLDSGLRRNDDGAGRYDAALARHSGEGRNSGLAAHRISSYKSRHCGFAVSLAGQDVDAWLLHCSRILDSGVATPAKRESKACRARRNDGEAGWNDGWSLNSSFRHSGGGRNPGLADYRISSYKSRHCRLAVSISNSFHARCHSLMAFSRRIADSMLS